MVLTSLFYGATRVGAAETAASETTTFPGTTLMMMKRNDEEDNNTGKKKTTKDVEPVRGFSSSPFTKTSFNTSAKKKLAIVALLFGFLSSAVASVSASLNEEGVSIPDVRLDQQKWEEEENQFL